MRTTLRRLVRERHELEMTPMIDVTFLLLVFFLCTLRFKDLEGLLAAHLPHDVGAAAERAEPPPEPVEVVVGVVTPGTRRAPGGAPWDPASGRRFVFGPDRVLEYAVGPWRTRDTRALEERLRARRLALEPLHEDPVRATVEARDGTVHQDVMAVLDRLTAAGFEQVGLVGAPPR